MSGEKEKPKLPVDVGIPLRYDRKLDFGVVNTLFQMLLRTKGVKLNIKWMPLEPVDSARNAIVYQHLEGDSQYLLFVDSDNPPYRGVNPLTMIDRDLDIVVWPTPMWKAEKIMFGRSPIEFNIYGEQEDDGEWRPLGKIARGLVPIVAGGTGCMLIARRVLEKVRPAFVREFDEHGIAQRSSDLLFCERALKEGFTVWADTDNPCHHFKQIDLLDVHQIMAMRDISHANRPNPNTVQYWNEEWPKRGERILPFYERIAEKLKAAGCKRVLDFGCGRGDLLKLLQDSGFQALGIDHAPEVVKICRDRGLNAEVGTVVSGEWDAIVSTEVLEHLDDDVGTLQSFFECTDHVLYSVPYDCFPPGMEPEHVRVYTRDYIEQITPYYQSVEEFNCWILVEAKRNRKRISDAEDAKSLSAAAIGRS